MSDRWVPLGADEDIDVYEALSEGIPAWLGASFWAWMRVSMTTDDGHGYEEFHLALLRSAERKMRFAVNFTGWQLDDGMHSLKSVLIKESRELAFADFLIANYPKGSSAQALERILAEAGSAWKVGTRMGKTGLERRVPEGAQLAAEEAMKQGGHAGQRLAEAWQAAFGINPDPSKAYSLAIKAMEDATIPVVSPNDTSATLGRINGTLKASGGWSLPFAREDQSVPSSVALLDLLKMVWAGQADRHGGHHDPDLKITQEAAECAVMFAVPVVHAFTSGRVSQRR